MPLDLDDVLNDTRWVTAYIGDHSFRVAYRPSATSMRDRVELKRTMRRMQTEEGQDEIDESVVMAKMLCEMVAEWDLERKGQLIPIEVDTLRDLPDSIFSAIMTAIGEDAEAQREEKKVSSVTSAAGLPREAKLANAQNGIPSSERRGTWA